MQFELIKRPDRELKKLKKKWSVATWQEIPMAEDRFQFSIAGCTDTGLRRKQNEDHIGFSQQFGIAVLADGMGGHQSGEIASHMAVESVLDKLHAIARELATTPKSSPQLLDCVSRSISHSNDMIYQAAEALEEHRGMGTTVVAAIAVGATLYAGHVGDSRIYLFRNQQLKQVTRDHSLLQDLIDNGYYTEQEARAANVGHIVTRALGSKGTVEVDTVELSLQKKDVLLLCSDGLTDLVGDWHIEEMLRESRDADLEQAAQKLVDQANRNGGNDNISVILMQAETHSDAVTSMNG